MNIHMSFLEDCLHFTHQENNLANLHFVIYIAITFYKKKFFLNTELRE